MDIKYLKYQYSMVHLIYWACNCTLGSFATVYLQYRGLSNTMIGIVVGGAAFLSIFAQPYVAQLVNNISAPTVKKMMQIVIVVLIALYILMDIIALDKIIIVLLYMAMCTLNYCMQTLLNAMGMEYIYISLSVILFVFVSFMKSPGTDITKPKTKKEKTQDKTFAGVLSGNRALLCILIGFCLANINNGAVGTYMVDIVKERGGAESILGIANFIASISEVPIMMLSGILLKKFNSIRLLKISAFFFWLKPVIILFSGSIPVLLFACTLQGLSYGIFFPTAVAYINQCMTPDTRLKGQAIFGVVTSGIAFGCGNMLGGWMLDVSGLKMLISVCAVISFFGCTEYFKKILFLNNIY